MPREKQPREEMSILRIIMFMAAIAIITGLASTALRIFLNIHEAPFWWSFLTGGVAGGACGILVTRRRRRPAPDQPAPSTTSTDNPS
jgi:hypothetical protein